MNDAKVDFKNKLLAVITEYTFDNDVADMVLARAIYRKINELFDAELVDDSVNSIPSWSISPTNPPIGMGEFVRDCFVLAKNENIKEIEEPEQQSLFVGMGRTLKGAVLDNFNEIEKIVEKHKSDSGLKINWRAATPEILANIKDIKHRDGRLPAYNELGGAYNTAYKIARALKVGGKGE